MLIDISMKYHILIFVFVCMRMFLSRYELQQRGMLHEEDVGVVPNIYLRNQDLDGTVKFLKREVEKYRDAAM